jgi:hypothetical protein
LEGAAKTPATDTNATMSEERPIMMMMIYSDLGRWGSLREYKQLAFILEYIELRAYLEKKYSTLVSLSDRVKELLRLRMHKYKSTYECCLGMRSRTAASCLPSIKKRKLSRLKAVFRGRGVCTSHPTKRKPSLFTVGHLINKLRKYRLGLDLTSAVLCDETPCNLGETTKTRSGLIRLVA